MSVVKASFLPAIVVAFFIGLYFGAHPYQEAMGYTPRQYEWFMVWSNTAPCPVAIARVVNDKMQELPVDCRGFKP
jgi:hypothetical protein